MRRLSLTFAAGALFAVTTPAHAQYAPAPDGAAVANRYRGSLIDAPARDAWLRECHRRMDSRDDGCEAYLDDWFASQSRQAMAQRAQLAAATPVAAAGPQCTETVEEFVEYVAEPVIRRAIPRAPARAPAVRDKRVRVY